MAPKKTTAAERKRRMLAERERLQAIQRPAPPLAENHEAILTAYTPRKVDPARWNGGMSEFVRDLVRRGQCSGDATVRQLLSEVTLYVDWAIDQGTAMTMEAILDHALIERWVAVNAPTGSKSTWVNRRSRLRNLASHALPSAKAPRRPDPYGRSIVKPPYTLRETAALQRLALSQPTAGLRRQLCAMVGVGLGAGLSSSDLRFLTAEHVESDLAGAYWVHVPGDRPRIVPVRAAYVTFIQEGLRGLKGDQLLLGYKLRRRGITAPIVARAAVGTTSVVPDQGRMRATWILAAMTAPIPLATLLATAGITSGRTLTDLLPYASDPEYLVIEGGAFDADDK